MKKIFITLLSFILIVLSVTSCSRPPEYSEVEERFRELIEASYDLNEILFGEGLPTYEKHYERVFEVYHYSEQIGEWIESDSGIRLEECKHRGKVYVLEGSYQHRRGTL